MAFTEWMVCVYICVCVCACYSCFVTSLDISFYLHVVVNLCHRHYVCACIRSIRSILPVSCARIPLAFHWILIFHLSANVQSETYVLKQQGHLYGISTLDFSSDGQYIATGGDDSKVKLWNASSGFCFVTFSEHVAPITGKWWREGGCESM